MRRSLTNANDDATYYPREQVHGNTGTGLTLDGTRIAYDMPLIAGTVTLTVAAGGNAKTGGAWLHIMT